MCFGSKTIKRDKDFISFDIVVVTVKKYMLLNSLFCKLAYRAYFWLILSYMLTSYLYIYGEIIFFFSTLILVRLWIIFEACGVNQMHYVAY